eukprot:14899403-Ditylum_brightwellii.AAC.1
MPTKPAGERSSTMICMDATRLAKRAKQGKTHTEADKVTYKDLNTFINAKVTAALKKAKKNLKQQKKEKQVELNAFDKFCTLNVES